MKFTGKTVVLMVSSSQFLLEGISHIIKVKKDDIEIVTKTLDGTIEEFIAQTNPQLVFIDNRTSEIDNKELLNSIRRTNADIKFILFNDERGGKENDSSNVIFITRESDSFELLNIMNNQGLDIMEGRASDNSLT